MLRNAGKMSLIVVLVVRFYIAERANSMLKPDNIELNKRFHVQVHPRNIHTMLLNVLGDSLNVVVVVV